MAKVARKVKPAKASKYINIRAGVVFDENDVGLLGGLRQALALERGGPVTISETVREAIRFRAKRRGISVEA